MIVDVHVDDCIQGELQKLDQQEQLSHWNHHQSGPVKDHFFMDEKCLLLIIFS